MNQVFFYGNGLNYLSDNPIGWIALLKKLMRDDTFDLTFLPNIMSYERIRLNWKELSKNPTNLKQEIAAILGEQKSNPFYSKLLLSGIDTFITTNYDYAIAGAEPELKRINASSEDIYSIRRSNTLLDKNRKVAQIWNIHGEIDHPKSIMLGLNHYCGSIGKINDYLKGTYDFRYKGQKTSIVPIEKKLEKNEFDHISWIELFFSSDVHIAGYGFDFSEIDLWWVLNRRARLKATSKIKNRIKYYTKPLEEVNKEKILVMRKREMLETFGVDIVDVSTRDGYEKHWAEIVEMVEDSMKNV